MLVYMFGVCVFMCGQVHLCVTAGPAILVFEAGSFADIGAHIFASLRGQQAGAPTCPYLTSTGVIST